MPKRGGPECPPPPSGRDRSARRPRRRHVRPPGPAEGCATSPRPRTYSGRGGRWASSRKVTSPRCSELGILPCVRPRGLGRGGGPSAVAAPTPITLNAIIYRYFQEPNNEKTNNGIHYKLQLLYSNGKWPLPPARPCPGALSVPETAKGHKDFEIKMTWM